MGRVTQQLMERLNLIDKSEKRIKAYRLRKEVPAFIINDLRASRLWADCVDIIVVVSGLFSRTMDKVAIIKRSSLSLIDGCKHKHFLVSLGGSSL